MTADQEQMLKTIIPLITFFLGSLFTIYMWSKQRKASLRAYPSIEEAYFPLDLSALKLKVNSKLYYAGDYEYLLKKYPTSSIIYLKITNLGPGHMLNCDIHTNVTSTDESKAWEFDIHIPMIMKDEYVLIPLATKDMDMTEVILKETKIKFLTQAQEQMAFEQQMITIEGSRTNIKEGLYVVRRFWLADKKLYEYKGKQNMFLYLNIKDKQSKVEA